MYCDIEIVHNNSKMSTIVAREIANIFNIPCIIKEFDDNNFDNKTNLQFLVFPVCGDNRISTCVENWLVNNVLCNVKYIVIILCDLDDSGISQNIITKEVAILVKKQLGICPIDPLLLDTQLGQCVSFKKNWIDAVKIFLKTGIYYPSIILKEIRSTKNIKKKIVKIDKTVIRYLEEDIESSIQLSFVDKKNSYKRSTLNNFTKEDIKSLTKFLLSYNKLKYLSIPNAALNHWLDLPNTFYEQIEVLDIRGNNFIDYNFLTRFQNLKKLNLANSNLTSIPDSVFSLKNLKILICNKNFISEIDKKISQLKNLEKLLLYRNNINDIPEELLQCFKLIYINLGGNKLEEPPDNIFYIKSLKELSLRNCNLKFLDKRIFKLENLCILDVSKNSDLQLLI